MQRAQESPSTVVPGAERSGLKPSTAFLVVLGLAAVIGTVVFLTRPEAAPPPTGTITETQPNFALTDEEAIARFEELQSQHLLAYKHADPSLLPSILTSNSRIGNRMSDEVRTLARDRVTAHFTYDTRSMEVVGNTPSQIQVRQIVKVESLFLDSDARDVTAQGKPELQEILWTLRVENDVWLIHDALIVAARPVRG